MPLTWGKKEASCRKENFTEKLGRHVELLHAM